MNRAELRRRVRIKLDDRIVPPLWCDDEINDALNEAVKEANLRARFLVDSTTPEVTVIAIQPGMARYQLHESIIVARRVEFAPANPNTQPFPMRRRSFDELDRRFPTWRSSTGTVPHTVVQDMDERALVLHPSPTAEGTLRLTVWRHPLERELMDSDNEEPRIPLAHHEQLAYWACFALYGNNEAEERDEARLQLFLTLFEGEFGKRPDAAMLRRLAVDHEPESQSYWY